MADNKFTRVPANSPDRCEASYRQGQCPYQKVPGCNYCPMHGGSSQAKTNLAEQKRIYRLSQWQQRINEMADDERVKNLREEIGILRMILEQVVNASTDHLTLLMNSNKISDLVIKIDKLVNSCHRLEAQTGMLLDKNAAIHLASVIVNIIGNTVTDAEAISNISNQIMLAIVNQRTEVKALAG